MRLLISTVLLLSGCVASASRYATVSFVASDPLDADRLSELVEPFGWEVQEVVRSFDTNGDHAEFRLGRRDGRGLARLVHVPVAQADHTYWIEVSERSDGVMFEMIRELRAGLGGPIYLTDPGTVHCATHVPPHLADARTRSFEEAEAELRSRHGCETFGRMFR